MCMRWEYTPAHPGYGIFLDYLNIRQIYMNMRIIKITGLGLFGAFYFFKLYRIFGFGTLFAIFFPMSRVHLAAYGCLRSVPRRHVFPKIHTKHGGDTYAVDYSNVVAIYCRRKLQHRRAKTFSFSRLSILLLRHWPTYGYGHM